MKDLLCLVHTRKKGIKKGMPLKCTSASSDKKCRCNNCIIYKKEQAKTYYLKNQEKLLIKKKEYYEKNREEEKKKSKKHYQENKESLLIRQKAYNKKNKQMLSIKNKEWKNSNTERISAKHKQWRENNRDKTREASRRRKAKKFNNGVEAYTEKQVLDLYGTKCYLCGELIDMLAPRATWIKGWQNGLHIEHVVDLALGGPDTLDNVRPSHGICNLKKKPRGMV
jgi:hypothetical protein